MNRYLILLLVQLSTSLFLLKANAQPPIYKKIIGSKKLPIELNLMIDSLQMGKDAEVITEKILPTILNIDSYARVLSKEDIFLIGKIEIYKSLLKSNEQSLKAKIDDQSIKLIDLALTKSSDRFVIWFLKALQNDCRSIILKPKTIESDSNETNKIQAKVSGKKFDKKIQLLYRWVSKLNPEALDFESLFKAELLTSMIDALYGIEHSFYLMASNTNFEVFSGLNKNTEEMKLFSLSEIKTQTKTVKKEKSVDDILDSVINEEQTPAAILLPQPSKEDWLNEENAPSNLKNLPKPAEDSEWLQDF